MVSSRNHMITHPIHTSISTQNIPKVVKGNLKVTTKTTLERYWLFFPERDLSDINLTRPDIRVNNLSYADG